MTPELANCIVKDGLSCIGYSCVSITCIMWSLDGSLFGKFIYVNAAVLIIFSYLNLSQMNPTVV